MFYGENFILKRMETCPLHINSELEVVLVKEGVVAVNMGNSSFKIGKSQITVIPPYRVHGFEANEDTDSLVYLFSDSMAADFFKLCKNKDIKNSVYFLNKTVFSYVEETTSKIIQSPNPFLEKSLLYALLSEFTINNSFTQMSFDASNANRIIEYIYSNIKSEISAKSVASEFAVSETKLNEMLTDYLGMGFREFIDSLRIKRATELLSKKDLNITEISYESGFETLRTFNRVFLRLTGCTPSQYRKNLK